MALVLKTLRLIAVTVALVAACGPPAVSSTPTPSPAASPAPTTRPADTKAGDLRTQLDLLLGEQVMMVAKQAVAASNHTDEYAGYLTLLASNTNSLVEVMRSAFGNTAATQFAEAWAIQNGYLVDYTIGVVTHNATKSNGAASGLVNGFTPQFAQLVTKLSQLSVDSLTQLVTTQLTNVKAVIDDEIGQSYTKMYADLRLAFASSAELGNTLALRMSQQFPDKFPGDASISAVDARVSLNELLQEDSYLTTMSSDAGVAGRGAEVASALGALASVRADLSPVMGFLMGPDARTGFGQLWGIRDADVLGYANSGDAATRQRLTGSLVTELATLLHIPDATVSDQMTATLKTIDDQRGKAYKQVPADDQGAAATMRALADRIA